MKKKIEPVKIAFEAVGRECNYNRRNRWFKALSEVVESGLITFKVCNPGQHWVKDDAKWNIQVNGLGMRSRTFTRVTTIKPYDVLRLVGSHLQLPEVREKVKSHVNLDLTCDRCGGQGFIPMFSYYCDGICFECYGSGYSKHKKTEVKILGPATI